MKLSDSAAVPPAGTSEEDIRKQTESNCKRIGDLQLKLYAEGKQSLLVILQGMDASGKDGAIKKVFSDVNPMGIKVAAFKKPTPKEYAHDFLWRIHAETPPAGMIHVFNRSHYEDIIMPLILGTHSEKEIAKRYSDINRFEQLLLNNGTRILKFFLHVTRAEQEERLHERMTNPKKFWKHKDEDWEFAQRRDEFLKIYEKIIRECDIVPWQVVASDKNWYKEWVISKAVMEMLEDMNPQYPPLVTSLKK